METELVLSVSLNLIEPAARTVAEVVIVGVTKAGLVANTKEPEPVSLEMTPANSALVVAAKALNLLAVYATVPPVPKATELASVPVRVRVLLAVRVLPSAIVRVAEVAGAVIATLFILVAVATPMVGVVKVGEVLNTILVVSVPVVPPALVI
jgi:hypothetical protein